MSKYIDTMHKWVKYYQNISEDEKRHAFQIVTNDTEKNTSVGYHLIILMIIIILQKIMDIVRLALTSLMFQPEERDMHIKHFVVNF